MIARTRAGLRKTRALRSGGRVAVVAPASPLKHDDHAQFAAGVFELKRLGFDVVFDEHVLDRTGYVAGAPERRARELRGMWTRGDIDAIVALRGGYGSVQLLPLLDATDFPDVPATFVGYSDVTSIHVYLACVAGITSVHGPMIDGRFAKGTSAYDERSFLGSLQTEALGELAPEGVSVIAAGEAEGPLFGGTLTQMLTSLGTPFAFHPPAGSILFIDEVGERPYRLDRMLVQLRSSGLLARTAGLIFGELPGCDEIDGSITAQAVVAESLRDYPGPVLFAFPSGHTKAPLVSLPFGAHSRVIAGSAPRLVVDESIVVG